ncbi:Calpain-7 [Triplophysa tibetana]|uniref:Calpain-7 n=1 Tax=Triplophysa tibetana TaxID=1572043 RepID=A0A5A9N3A4_9TELE|nr:Calpain-7 [Triplophysa tibetana]
MDCTALEHDAIKFAKLAVQHDQKGKYNEAVFYYKEAAQALIYAGMAGSKLENIQDKVNEYMERVQTLLNAVQAQSCDPLKSKHQSDLERAYFLVTQAFEEDEKENADEAIELYTQAVELCIQTSNETSDQALQGKLKQLARQALDRAEGLKDSLSKPVNQDKPTPKAPAQVRQFLPLGQDFSLHDRSQPVRAVQSCEPQGERYTAEEIEVLRKTSKINGIEYVPFMRVDLRERFAFPVPFSDKCGKLALSPKQKAIFSRWVRPDDICNNPIMIYTVSSFSIKQTVVSDCSFVASLAISAAYERRYSKKLITSIIFPQNRKGEPEYNPCGKYMVKLHINGVPRKVIIDDFLPVDHNGELLCSYSSNRNELWVSLIEKAYMKVMGGYDFPGSNSNIDLHALTGWIPERIAMHSDNQSFNKDDTFRMLYQRFHRGDVLVTTATGVMTEEEGERWGLVPTHAYAVLDIREYKGKRFLQLKNPWSHLRWKGRYSERDEKNWTPDLLKYLNFDPKTAQKFDNGVFWIIWEDLCQYYDVIYLSWNPALFKESSCIHSSWDGKQGPVKDVYSLANNPQYKLEVNCPQGGAAVWVLLTRHITDKDDFAQNREFITLVVYKSDGKKVYYPADPPPFIDGIRINSPHYLTKIKLTSPGTFTLVVSQYEKQNTINYTLRCRWLSDRWHTNDKVVFNYTIPKRTNCTTKGVFFGASGDYRDTHLNNAILRFFMWFLGSMLLWLFLCRELYVLFEDCAVSSVLSSAQDPLPSKDKKCTFNLVCIVAVPVHIFSVNFDLFLQKKNGHFIGDFHSLFVLKTSCKP